MPRIILWCLFVLFSCTKPTPKTIVILGNSITFHGPYTPVGWKGSWGMAASDSSKDYVHILRNETGLHIITKTIVGWEKDFNYDLTKDSLKFLKPDILLIRLGENVKDFDHYYAALEELSKVCTSGKIIVTGTFWAMQKPDSIQERFARDHGYPFVSFRHLWWEPSFAAYGLFENAGVAAHPGDKGMKAIADAILSELRK